MMEAFLRPVPSGTGAIPLPYRAIGYSYTLSLFVFQV